MYKTSFYRFGEVQVDHNSPPGFDRTRNVEIGVKNIKLKHVEEAFTTEHWLVRIYKVKKEINKSLRLQKKPITRPKISGRKRYISQKTSKKQAGVLRNKPIIEKGIGTRTKSTLLL